MNKPTMLSTLALAAVLAACGGGGASPSPSPASPSAAASKPAAASAAASASAKPAAASAAASAPAAASAAGSAAAKPAPSLVAATTVAMLKVGDSSLGKVLTDDKGKTLYSYDEATSPASKDATKCVTACLTPWPPLLTSDVPQAPAGVTGKLGVITRTDFNVKQVTYNDMPLYYFIQDQAAGDVKGQNSKGFGGNWQVIKVG